MTSVPQPNDDRTWQFAGREFCNFGVQHGISCTPVDEHERIRFAEFNRTITTIILGGDPIVVPEFPSDDIDEPKVLDCGFGTGAWISDLQDEEIYSHCVVFGIDIFDCDAKRIIDEDDEETEDDERQDSPVQEFVKIKWNLNAPFARHPELGRGTFHLINSRFLADGIDKNRWEPLVREYMEMLAPEGWLQMVEFDWVFQSDRGQNLPNLERWWNMYSGALRSMRKEKDPVVARKLHQLMANAGFDTIKEERKRVPVGDWSNDDTDGVMLHRSWTREVISNMLESFALVPFTRVLGRTQSECESIVRAAQGELRTPNAKIYNTLRIVYGRKPPNR